MDFSQFIEIKPDVRSGKPCLKGTRITVYDIFEYLAGGMTEKEIMTDFPVITPKLMQMIYAFAAAREHRLASSAA